MRAAKSCGDMSSTLAASSTTSSVAKPTSWLGSGAPAQGAGPASIGSPKIARRMLGMGNSLDPAPEPTRSTCMSGMGPHAPAEGPHQSGSCRRDELTADVGLVGRKPLDKAQRCRRRHRQPPVLGGDKTRPQVERRRFDCLDA